MKIGFATDTNILKKNNQELYNEEKYLDNIDFFLDYIKISKKANRDKKLLYFMPRTIIEELYYQKKESFEKEYSSLEERYTKISYGLRGKLPKNNINKIIKSEKNKYISDTELILLDIPYTKSIFKELIDDSLNKRPPFDKSQEGKKTDSGYKDALIWKTILYSKRIDECDIFYFFSGDNVFKSSESVLKEEFKKHHPKVNIKIFFIEPNGNQRQECLKIIIDDNNLIETDIIKLFDMELVLDVVQKLKYNYSETVYYDEEFKLGLLEDILFDKISAENLNIRAVVPVDNKYEITIYINTDKYKISEDVAFSYFKKVNCKIKLIFEKNNNDFAFREYNILWVSFMNELNYYGSLLSQALTDSINKVNYNSALDTIVENFKNNFSTEILKINKISNIINYTPPWIEELKKYYENNSFYKAITEANNKTESIDENGKTIGNENDANEIKKDSNE